MRKLSTLALAGAVLFAGNAEARDVYVQGYQRDNGTYVQPYYRTAPDSTTLNNYSTQGNTNPYTGKSGYESPYSSNSLGGGTGLGTYGDRNPYSSTYGR